LDLIDENNSPLDLLDTCNLFSLMSESQKDWWIGLPKELENDIELEE